MAIYDFITGIFFLVCFYCSIAYILETCDYYRMEKRLSYQEAVFVYYYNKRNPNALTVFLEIRLPNQLARGQWDATVPISLEEWESYGTVWKAYIHGMNYGKLKALMKNGGNE